MGLCKLCVSGAYGLNFVQKIENWVTNLQGKGASDQISEEEKKQLQLDLEMCFVSFKALLEVQK